MIASDQPIIFGSAVKAAISSKSDGNMKYGMGNDGEVEQNRRQFLHAAGISIDDTTLVGITYATDDFTKYRIVKPNDKTVGMLTMANVEHADALVVDTPGHALFLPLADCVGAVLYDEAHHVLMVSHIGRHSAEAHGATKSVKFLVKNYHTDPAVLRVWLSPGVGKASYPLHKFSGESLHEVITRQLVEAGVVTSHIENGHIDTAISSNYYSHSEYLKGNDDQGRFAIVAEMREQGEPAF